MRYFSLRFTVACCCACLAHAAVAADPDAKEIALFNGKDLVGWEHFLVDAATKKEDVWSVKDGLLVCQG